MGIRGALTKDKMGNSMPVDAPLYGRLPVLYKSVSMLIYEYVTDASAAAALLPAQLELTDPPIAMLLFAEYPWSTIGPYNEVAQALQCTYKGKPMTYAVRLHVTTDRALTMGRECGGFPKKLGVIPFVKDVSYASLLERPAGIRICSGVMEPATKLPKILDPIDFASLRLIPNIATPEKPSLLQLMHTRWVFQNGELWAGNGSCSFTGASDLDPYHKLPVLKQVASMIYLGDMQVASPGAILEDLS